MKEILAYAGIGSRNISDDERETIESIATIFSLKEFYVYSGNANGADIAFQSGSGGNCVIMLPYKNFNKKNYDINNSKDYFVCGKTDIGNELIDRLHPAPEKLMWNTKPFLNRNAHQILGIEYYPKVKFVICCADVDKDGNEIGGTGHACRIAREQKIPVINIRKSSWKFELKVIFKKYKKDNDTNINEIIKMIKRFQTKSYLSETKMTEDELYKTMVENFWFPKNNKMIELSEIFCEPVIDIFKF